MNWCARAGCVRSWVSIAEVGVEVSLRRASARWRFVGWIGGGGGGGGAVAAAAVEEEGEGEGERPVVVMSPGATVVHRYMLACGFGINQITSLPKMS
jgi:hypothetical protein